LTVADSWQATASLSLVKSSYGASFHPRERIPCRLTGRSFGRWRAMPPANRTRRPTQNCRSVQDLAYDHTGRSASCRTCALARRKMPFEVQFFHAIFYTPRVDIYEVNNGQATKIAYRRDDFLSAAMHCHAQDRSWLAGFRLHAPINRRDYTTKYASSWRKLFRRWQGEIYGLSAGDSRSTPATQGEDFPCSGHSGSKSRHRIQLDCVHALPRQ